MTTIDLTAIRRAKRGQTPAANLARRAFYFVGDDIYYHASTGEWARAIEDEAAREPTIAGFLLTVPPRGVIVPVDFHAALEMSNLNAADIIAEREHQRQLTAEADRFERAPSGHFAAVLGTGKWGAVLAVGRTPEEASDNATVAEQEVDPDLDVASLHRSMRFSGSLSVRPITRAALSAFREDGQDCRFTITGDGRVDVATDGDDWHAEVN